MTGKNFKLEHLLSNTNELINRICSQRFAKRNITPKELKRQRRAHVGGHPVEKEFHRPFKYRLKFKPRGIHWQTMYTMNDYVRI